MKRTMGNESSTTRAKVAFFNGPKSTKGGKWVSDVIFDELSEQIGKSFAGTETIRGEPILSWMLETSMKIPNQSSKVVIITFLTSYFIYGFLAKKGVAFCKKTEQGDIASTLLIREWSISSETGLWRIWTEMVDKIRRLILSMRLGMAGEIPELFTSKKFEDDANRFSIQAKAISTVQLPSHIEHGPKEKHWYVAVVATSPSCQGQGVGSEMMSRIGELADAERIDCYLECGKENLRFYEKCGYRAVATKMLQNQVNPNDGQPFETSLMIRPHFGK
jgi:GNAT superfamily N-acetyltransferase